jgi:hypothetical protein
MSPASSRSHRKPEPCSSPASGRFYAYATNEGPCSGHKVQDADTFTEAAIGFLECWGPGDEAAEEVSVTVIDCETGEEQCFRIAVATGAMRAC